MESALCPEEITLAVISKPFLIVFSFSRHFSFCFPSSYVCYDWSRLFPLPGSLSFLLLSIPAASSLTSCPWWVFSEPLTCTSSPPLKSYLFPGRICSSYWVASSCRVRLIYIIMSPPHPGSKHGALKYSN